MSGGSFDWATASAVESVTRRRAKDRVRMEVLSTALSRFARADVAKEAAAAAVGHVLQLDGEPVGVGEIELRRAAFRAAAVRHAERDIGHERFARRIRHRLEA